MGREKVKHSWSDLNYKKRKIKKQRTEERLKKVARTKKNAVVNNAEAQVAKEGQKGEEQKIIELLPTVSIAVPGSILDNAQSFELRTYLAGQIARAACIYQIDEVVVFNDQGPDEVATGLSNSVKIQSKSCQNLATILQYLECPQYLRKHLFPIQKALKFAGVLNPLDAPHHLRKDDKFPFREGVVLTLPPKPGKGSYVDVGLAKPVIIDRVLEPYFRVTVRMHSKAYEMAAAGGRVYGTVVSPSVPKRETGTYWGYSVRVADSLNEVFTHCSYPTNYDLTIGTSDKGTSVDELEDGVFDSYTHCLILFGGLQGLEFALENDEQLKLDDVSLLCDHYVNTCPSQASRTIRTEEALLISLAELRKKLNIRSKNLPKCSS